MVVCEVTLRCREQLLFRVTCELRPALAIGDPPVPSVRDNCGHVVWLSFYPLARPTEGIDCLWSR
jgi:hypothetical protein